MSTQRINSAGARMAQLFKANEKIFHIRDLALLWDITDNNALRTTIKRYCKKGLIYRIFKGLYSVIPQEKLDLFLLGEKVIHNYCYISTESILFLCGYISHKITTITFISEKSERFNVAGQEYRSRQLKRDFLYHPEGLIEKDGVLYANTDRAIADMLYFNPKFHFDRPIDWEKVKKIQRTIGYPLTTNRYVDPECD